ncbi:cupin domain-containing protein [Adhaeribacter soli]|uniref:Cupin domain-containing protein n=1 Tax=Adhaeribacter soli TaxID=2607655 RepID=A0A5N1JA44_9BACT|nr:cupin domain-containing protein [Adhaeribacter soli]KAA9345709.1 cupin domain-containing protein [Adhaeribacter soli]
MSYLPENPEITENMENLADQISYAGDNFQRKVVLDNDGQRTILLAFSAGQCLPEHKTSKDALLVILEGFCEFSMQGNVQLLRAGEVILIPAREPHSLKAIADFKMLLVK